MTEIENKLLTNMKSSIDLISNSNINFIEFGLFGSAANGSYKCGSDIDIVLIVSELPNKRDIADLRCKLDYVDCDLAVMLKSSFDNPTTPFHKNVIQSYRRLR